MAQVLSYPFRITPAGGAATVDETSDQAYAESLAVLILTRRGAMPLAADFGLTDPAFAGVAPSELAGQVARWGPPVQLVGVTDTPTAVDRSAVRVTFT